MCLLLWAVRLGQVCGQWHLKSSLLTFCTVENALRNNPFAPYVPCHRVVASDLSLGGFFGERATSKSARGAPLGENCKRKVELLIQEGVLLGKGGRCVVRDAIWEK